MTTTLAVVLDVPDEPPAEAPPHRPRTHERLAAARAALTRAETAAGVRSRLAGPGLSTSRTLTTAEADRPAAPAAVEVPVAPAAAYDPERVLPVPAVLAPLFPAGGLPRGGVVEVGGSTSVLLALAAAAARDGAWCALTAMPHIGWRAAAGAGLALDRVAVVPAPGPDAATVLGALADGFDVLVVGRCAALADRDRRSLAARVRARGAVLLSTQAWPGAQLSLRASGVGWEGVGQGWGHLTEQDLRVRAAGRPGAADEVLVRVTPDGLRAPAGAVPPGVVRPAGETADQVAVPLLRAV